MCHTVAFASRAIVSARFRQGQSHRKMATQSHRSKERQLHDSGTAGNPVRTSGLPRFPWRRDSHLVERRTAMTRRNSITNAQPFALRPVSRAHAADPAFAGSSSMPAARTAAFATSPSRASEPCMRRSGGSHVRKPSNLPLSAALCTP